ncbi:MAG: zinc ABC transporter substrate-binding protein, partial [Planctomycetota bacterium]
MAVAGCSTEQASKQVSEAPLQVAATTGMVADLLRNVGGKHVEIQQVMGAGVDPHLYKATRDDVQTIMSADAVFYSGLMLEGKMADTLMKVGRTRPVFAVTELIDESQLLEPDDAPGHPDPHVWMDVAAWSECIDAVADALVELLPAHAKDITANAGVYRQRLAALED